MGNPPEQSVMSADGTRIRFYEAGNADRPSLLLIHGWAQQSVCWRPVVEHLSDRFRLVSMDLRGHGASDKPDSAAAYTDTALWSEDVRAVIDAADLQMPVLVGWSYGARVIAAHLAECGSGHLAGVVLAGGILAIGAAREDWMAGPASPGRDPDLFSDDVPSRLTATVRFVDACTEAPLDRASFAELVGANMLCPALVRRALFAADVDLRPVFRDMECEALVIHGAADRVVTPETGVSAARLMRTGGLISYDGIGHAPFLEAPDRFARDVGDFATSVHEKIARRWRQVSSNSSQPEGR